MKFDSKGIADEVKSKYGAAIKQLLTLITRQTAGQVCLLCVNPANLSQIFSANGKPKLIRSEFDKFVKDVSDQLSILNDLANKTGGLLNSTFEAVMTSTDKKCS